MTLSTTDPNYLTKYEAQQALLNKHSIHPTQWLFAVAKGKSWHLYIIRDNKPVKVTRLVATLLDAWNDDDQALQASKSNPEDLGYIANELAYHLWGHRNYWLNIAQLGK